MSSQKEKEIRCHVFPSSIKREIRKLKFHIVASRVVTAKKCTKMYVQSFCFADLNLLLFCRSRCRRRCLSSLINRVKRSLNPGLNYLLLITGGGGEVGKNSWIHLSGLK